MKPSRLHRLFHDVSVSPVVMGILNVTPDSFSDGGCFLEPDRAVDRALVMIGQGARIIDVGPESTKPGSTGVDAKEQIARSVGVIQRIREQSDETIISIDTRLAPVAKEACQAGADIVNDVSALRDDRAMVDLVASSNVGVVLMHRRGTSEEMQQGGGPVYENVVGDIAAFLTERVGFAVQRGVDPDRIMIDPGIGFGKRVDDNLTILRELRSFTKLGPPVLVGASRKRFIGTMLGETDANVFGRDGETERGANGGGPEREMSDDRLAGSLACAATAVMNGAGILRVHDVAETVSLLQILRAMPNPPRTAPGV